jgi:tetratricopeptide (TPR) repeat protein
MSDGEELGLLGRIRRHERGLALAWCVLVGLFALAVAVGPVRDRLLDIADGVIRRWDARWTVRLEEGDRLVREERWDEAVVYLERLDATFPARDVRHRRDMEREYLLRLLGRTYEALDRRGRATETYERLVAFDPRHYRNYFEQGQALDRLRSRASMAVEARDAFAAALTIFPSHLPSLRGYIQYYLDRGEFGFVVDAYETYLDAILIHPVTVQLGLRSVEVPVLIDGRARDYDVSLADVPPAGVQLSIATDGFSGRVEQIELLPAVPAGQVAAGVPVVLDTREAVVTGGEAVDNGAFRGLDQSSTWHVDVPDATPVRRLRLRLALYKPMDAALWAAVAKSYDNLLDQAGLSEAAARTMTLPLAAEADMVVDRLPWARTGVWRGIDGHQD